MAHIRLTAAQAKARGRSDKIKIAATTEADIRGHLAEDGYDPDRPLAGLRPITPVAVIRRSTGLTQDQFAKALRIPAATLRNWEQGRTAPDPVARSFFALVGDDPKRALKVLGRRGGARAV